MWRCYQMNQSKQVSFWHHSCGMQKMVLPINIRSITFYQHGLKMMWFWWKYNKWSRRRLKQKDFKENLNGRQEVWLSMATFVSLFSAWPNESINSSLITIGRIHRKLLTFICNFIITFSNSLSQNFLSTYTSSQWCIRFCKGTPMHL